MSLLFDFATKNLHLATIFYHLVAKWRLNNFFNFEPCEGSGHQELYMYKVTLIGIDFNAFFLVHYLVKDKYYLSFLCVLALFVMLHVSYVAFPHLGIPDRKQQLQALNLLILLLPAVHRDCLKVG